MSGTNGNGVSRRQVLSGAAKAAVLAVTGTGGLAAPAIAQQSKDRIILAMSQEPVQFNPLLYVNTGTENVRNPACSMRCGTSTRTASSFQTWRRRCQPAAWRYLPRRPQMEGCPQARREVERRTTLNRQGCRVHLPDHHKSKVAVRSRGGFDSIKNFKVVDDYTVEMELARPSRHSSGRGRTCTLCPHTAEG